MNINYFRESCCGCSSCEAVCPKNAISMEMTNEGFLYPAIDKNKCIDCSICVRKCPVYMLKEKSAPIRISALYGWNKDNEIRVKSSSGGAFSALADKVLSQNGIVFGAAFDSDTKLVRYMSSDEVGLDAIRRSKYTECHTEGVFGKVKACLKEGRTVLFCGTPCHVAGLKIFLDKDDENLLTCDFVCGGASSAAFLVEHLQNIEKKVRKKIVKVNFRDKKYGWKRMTFTVMFENGKEKSTISYFDSYFTGFIEGITKRSNCFSCPYADNHFADITIADFWGYKRVEIPYDPMGISMLVVNTEKGKLALDGIESKLELHEMDVSIPDYTIKKRCVNVEKKKERDAFFEMAELEGFDLAAKHTYMPQCFRNLIKDMLHL